jgi:single-strand DNA-binding protein
MNQITITGNLGKDPVLKFTKDNFSLAVGQRHRVNGEWVDGLTMWFQVTFFGGSAEKVVDRFVKGNTVTITGRLAQSQFTTDSGEVRTSLDIIGSEIEKVERVSKDATEDAPATSTQSEDAPF